MFLMSNSTKICNVFNKYKSKIVQLNFKITLQNSMELMTNASAR